MLVAAARPLYQDPLLAKNRGSAKKITFDAKAIDAAMRAAENDLTRFGLVASSRGPSPEEVEIVVRIYREIKKRANIHLCASLGIASYEVMKKLKEAGVSRYHCNLESCKSFFPKLCISARQSGLSGDDAGLSKLC